MKKILVQTSINPPTKDMLNFTSMSEWDMIVIGDRKTPNDSYLNVPFIFIPYYETDPDIQNHYARKNLGYLEAIRRGADIIAETDDDNSPLLSWGSEISFTNPRALSIDAYRYGTTFNVYKYFYEEEVWPRGYPLSRVKYPIDIRKEIISQKREVGVWQFLIEDDPDVDAIHRLVFNNTGLKCNTNKKSVILGRGILCPFNSQNTFWNRKVFPLMYLPVTVNPRYTDILRGYIAQRLMWDYDLFLAFGRSTVVQRRNLHNLMQDFSDEVHMYTTIDKVIDILLETSTENLSSFSDKMTAVYSNLIFNKIVSERELEYLSWWIASIEEIF